MRNITETDLPGVGARFELQTDSGRRVGVIVHQTGRRDLLIYDEQDPDRAGESVELSEDEGHTVGELLGGSPLLDRLGDAIHRLEDLVIAWVRVDAGSPLAGLTIAETELRKRTGAGVVALLCESGSIPVPGGSERLSAGDTAVLVGLPSAVEAASGLLASEPSSEPPAESAEASPEPSRE